MKKVTHQNIERETSNKLQNSIGYTVKALLFFAKIQLYEKVS